MGTPAPLRASKVATGETTRWKTSSGGFFVEPIQRPDTDATHVTITVRMPSPAYKLLEFLFDDVSAYIARLLTSHVQGLVKSAKHNAERNRT